jgi:hypothetical protein
MNNLTVERIREIWAQMVKDKNKKEKFFYHKGLGKWVNVKDWDFLFKNTEYDRKKIRVFSGEKD